MSQPRRSLGVSVTTMPLWADLLPLRYREIIQDMAPEFDRRHPRAVILIRVLVTAWLLALTGILLAYGYWGWALVTIAGAVANIVWAYRVYRATMH